MCVKVCIPPEIYIPPATSTDVAKPPRSKHPSRGLHFICIILNRHVGMHFFVCIWRYELQTFIQTPWKHNCHLYEEYELPDLRVTSTMTNFCSWFQLTHLWENWISSFNWHSFSGKWISGLNWYKYLKSEFVVSSKYLL